MSKKSKTNLIIGAVIVVVIAIACTAMYHKNTTNDAVDNHKTIPDIFEQPPARPKYTKPVAMSKKKRDILAELMGKITNKYGIRDDVLAYILSAVPADNPGGRELAIHQAQNQQDTYYNPNPQQQLYDSNVAINIMGCSHTFFKGDPNPFFKVVDGIDALYRNTPDRNAWANHVEYSLGGHVFSSVDNSNGVNYQTHDEYCRMAKYWK